LQVGGQRGPVDNPLEFNGFGYEHPVERISDGAAPPQPVAAAELVSLIAANGAGKTTCLRTVSGLTAQTDGDIRFEGQPTGGPPPPAGTIPGDS
jgi:ABC-type multidrug transport system fused ATPase/permease subunit